MTEGLDKKRSFREKLRDTYRLVVLSDETFSEVASYRLTLLNVYVLLSSCIVVLSLLIVALIAFTPVKRLIPGYGEIESNTRFIELYANLEEIETSLSAQELYMQRFRKMLTADESNGDTLSSDEPIAEVVVDAGIFEPAEVVIEPNVGAQQKPFKMGGDLQHFFFVPPVSGRISATYMPEKRHFGVDILAAKNTPIKAVLDGFVITSGWDLETGNTIGIQHDDNLVSFYKHNSVLLKEAGSYVRAGEAVAIIGNTGTLSDGPHLHFELWYRGRPVNPQDYVNFN